jgi:pyruvate,water dikinase
VQNVNSLPELDPGDILVARNIGPRWTPIFPLLGGLVLETGSVGQHAAVTAREYGIAAVISTGDATKRIPDKSTVIVDGTRGIVQIREK